MKLVLHLHFTPEFVRKIRGLTRSMTHGTFQRSLLVNQFVAPTAQVGYCHKYMTGHPELRKGRCCLFVSSKDSIAGKELSAASISRWICTTTVDSHASLQSNENIPGKVKAQEVHAVATSLYFSRR